MRATAPGRGSDTFHLRPVGEGGQLKGPAGKHRPGCPGPAQGTRGRERAAPPRPGSASAEPALVRGGVGGRGLWPCGGSLNLPLEGPWAQGQARPTPLPRPAPETEGRGARGGQGRQCPSGGPWDTGGAQGARSSLSTHLPPPRRIKQRPVVAGDPPLRSGSLWGAEGDPTRPGRARPPVDTGRASPSSRLDPAHPPPGLPEGVGRRGRAVPDPGARSSLPTDGSGASPRVTCPGPGPRTASDPDRPEGTGSPPSGLTIRFSSICRAPWRRGWSGGEFRQRAP